MADTYKPSENDGLRKDGQPDQRMQQESFGYGKVDPAEAGKKGGSQGGSSTGDDDSSSNDSRSKGQFAGGKVDPVEAGRKGGSS